MKAKNYYTIYRDVYTTNPQTGLLTKRERREFLHITAAGRYIWKSEPQSAARLECLKSCQIIDNLQRINRTRYNYGKIRN